MEKKFSDLILNRFRDWFHFCNEHLSSWKTFPYISFARIQYFAIAAQSKLAWLSCSNPHHKNQYNVAPSRGTCSRTNYWEKEEKTASDSLWNHYLLNMRLMINFCVSVKIDRQPLSHSRVMFSFSLLNLCISSLLCPMQHGVLSVFTS